jgi:hypothetical protein
MLVRAYLEKVLEKVGGRAGHVAVATRAEQAAAIAAE